MPRRERNKEGREARDQESPDSARYRAGGGSPRDADIAGYPDIRGAEAAGTSGDADLPQADTSGDADIPQADTSGDADIPGYQGAEEEHLKRDSERYPHSGPGPLTYKEAIADQPLFPDSGFESIDDYLEHLDDIARMRLGLPALVPPGLKRVRPDEGMGTKQVGLRLPRQDFEKLQEAADEFGVPSATLARMLVARAVRAWAAATRQLPE